MPSIFKSRIKFYNLVQKYRQRYSVDISVISYLIDENHFLNGWCKKEDCRIQISVNNYCCII